MGARDDLMSIVIRTHDRPVSMVTEAVASALGQSGAGDYEVVVVHTDRDPRRICGMLADLDPDARLARQVYAPEAAGNRAAACNAGARAARGDWIRYLDDDDLLAPAALRLYRRRLAETGGVCPVVWSDKYLELAPQGRRRLRRRIPRLSSVQARGAGKKAWRLRCADVGTGTLFARRSLLVRHPYDAGYPAAEDAEWLFRMAFIERTDMDFLPAILTCSRMHGGNTDRTVGDLHAYHERAVDGVESALRSAGRPAEADDFSLFARHRCRDRLRARILLANACSRSRLATHLYLRYHGVHDAFGFA